jgi:hypothetical protein
MPYKMAATRVLQGNLLDEVVHHKAAEWPHIIDCNQLTALTELAIRDDYWDDSRYGACIVMKIEGTIATS